MVNLSKNLRLVRFMIIEEYRMQTAMIGKLQFLFFPFIIAIFAFILSVSSSALLKSISIQRIFLIFHSIILMYGLGIGGFALFGEHVAERRFGGLNLLLTSPTLHPIDFKRIFLIFYIKEVVYYLLFSIVPIFIGMVLSIPVTSFNITSVLFLFFTTVLTFLLGISFSFFLSSIYVRWRKAFAVTAATILVILIAAFIGHLFQIRYLIPSLMFHYTKSPVYFGFTLILMIIFSIFAILFIKIEPGRDTRRYPSEIMKSRELFGFTRDYSHFLAKEWLDLKRSGTLYPVIGAYIGPLIFLAVIAWFLDGVLMLPIHFNVIFYAAMIGFFGVEVYGWLNIIDTPNFYEALPVTVSRVIKTKLLLFVIITSATSTTFIIILSIINYELHLLWLALIVAFSTTIYTLIVTAYLTGLRTNSYLFDPKILGKFTAMVASPLIVITIASFTLSSAFFLSVSLIGGICMALAIFTIPLFKKIEIRWNKEEFTL